MERRSPSSDPIAIGRVATHQVPLNAVPSSCWVSCTTQLSANSALDAIIYTVDKDVEEHRCQDGPQVICSSPWFYWTELI